MRADYVKPQKNIISRKIEEWREAKARGDQVLAPVPLRLEEMVAC